MKSLNVPGLDHLTVYRDCATQTGNAGDRQTLLAMTGRIVAAGVQYAAAAALGRLDTVSQIALNDEESRLLKPLYEKRLQDKKGSGRYAYDEIRSSAGFCPLCIEGEVYEVDHFLPQGDFRDRNVLPINLIPICHPCNNIKLQTLPISQDEHFLHPYFDQLPTDVQWLHADLEIVAGGPVLRFWVELDEAVHGPLARRLTYHFGKLQLANRFRQLSAPVLAVLEDAIAQHLGRLGPAGMAEHFKEEGERFFRVQGNCLDAAAHFAAAASNAYCQGAYVN